MNGDASENDLIEYALGPLASAMLDEGRILYMDELTITSD